MNPVEIVSRSVGVRLNLTASDWQLYDLPGCEEAAEKINRRLEQVLLDCTGDWYSRCYSALSLASDYGATDTEGTLVLEAILKQLNLVEEV